MTERTSIEQLKIHYNFFDYIKKTIILFLVKFTYKKANQIIANSKRERLMILNYFANAKQNTSIPPSFKKYLNFKTKKNKICKILTVGSLTKEKGLDTIIKSLSLLSKHKFRLDILGKGYDIKQNEKNYLNLLINQNKLRKKIKLHGYKKNLSKFYKIRIYI